MSDRSRRWLASAVSVVILLAILFGGLGWSTVQRSMPVVSGDLTLPGLHAPVDVLRDAAGVPSIYASDEHDLFMAQGYVHAQDRFWQMDFWRHLGAGRLAEMFGASQVGTDKFLRTLGWERVAQQELDQLDPDTLAILQAYADGVNAYLADHQGAALSLEYAILKLLSPSYHPEPWAPINTLTWAKAMAWDLGGNMDGEIERAQLLRSLTLDQVNQLYPPYPSDHPTIVKEFGPAGATVPDARTDAIRQAAPEFAVLSEKVAQLNATLGGGLPGVGSNNWVIGGRRTQTGQPMLANDPHLGIQMPSIWYQVNLHCRTIDSNCRYDVGGFSFAGAPGVIIGHNGHIAWGLTNVGPDVQDLFIEKINPDNPDQYEFNGQWKDMTLVHETIRVAGAQDVDLTVRSTRHGPIVTPTYAKLEDFTDQAGIPLPAPHGLALQWTALQPTRVFAAVLEYDRATDWEAFRQALRDFDVPSQNFVFADTQGNIGYQMPGKIPIRAGGDGWLPVPGWTTDYDWTGLIPFDQLPSAFNPTDGYIVTANNAVAGSGYPNFISRDWDYGYRAARIAQMIDAKSKLSKQDVQAIQGDDLDPAAGITLPYLLKLKFDDPLLSQALESLTTWDQQDTMNSTGAAVFNLFWGQLILDTFSDEIPDGPVPDGSRAMAVFATLMSKPDSPWWDDHNTEPVESRDDVLRSAFSQAVNLLGKTKMGSDLQQWQWGRLHTATFRNQSLGESGISPIEQLFNRGPLAVSGGTSIVNATEWKVDEGFDVTSLPSMRIINDLSNWDDTLWIQTTGQSGHAFNTHYFDQADPWRQIRYMPMAWSESAVHAAATAVLTLHP